MSRVVPRKFYNDCTLNVAESLLGMNLCRRLPSGKIERRMIMETEAYDGFEDKASHAHKGETPRTSIMYGAPGYAYIYLCYGVHWLLNFSTREKGYPAAVLIRGVVGADGPGKLTKALLIDKQLNGLALSRKSGLWVEDDGIVVPEAEIERTPRIGIDYAGEKWVKAPYRYVWRAC